MAYVTRVLAFERTALNTHFKCIAVVLDSRHLGMQFEKYTRDLDFYVQHTHRDGKEQD